uniref:Small ribosomal subunit protein uS15c n=1 Tax=Stangeria eriopus TaxID=34343 RepID=A0A0A6Z7W5_STAER|nr:ribosomal protein S15 [Stangeria eriopus]AFR45444.1 ribosomal protein S15 [Stangeria eriopus]BAR93433.1 ribosomal protein S15 [Stangeria eriopus]
MQKNAPIRSLEERKEGSVEYQICHLTDRILRLTRHLELHRRDYSSQRGLWQILGKRKRLLVYLSKRDILRYDDLISKLSIRGLKTR